MAYVTTTEHLGGGTATLIRTESDAVALVRDWVAAHKTTTVVLRCAHCTATYTKRLTSGDEIRRTQFAASGDGWDCDEDGTTDYCPNHTGDLR